MTCENSDYDELDHFADVGKMVKLESGAKVVEIGDEGCEK